MATTAYDSLSPRHRSFVDSYTGTAGFNATEAYRLTYGCKASTANTNGPALLVKAGISAAIAERLDAEAMDATETLARLSRVARNVGSAYLRPNGTYDLDALLADGHGDAVKAIRVSGTGRVLVELHDAQKALTTLARVHGLFAPQKVEMTTPVDVSPARLASVLDQLVDRTAHLEDGA
jgi:hypothetical protein